MKNMQLRSLLLAFVLAASFVYAQAPTGTISGTVADESGAVIPSASVTVTEKETGAVRTLTSGADGTFTAAALPAGTALRSNR